MKNTYSSKLLNILLLIFGLGGMYSCRVADSDFDGVEDKYDLCDNEPVDSTATINCIGCPETPAKTFFDSPSQINLFLETSGSMRGLMPRGNTTITAFQRKIPALLAGLNEQTEFTFYSFPDSRQPFEKIDAHRARRDLIPQGDFQWGAFTHLPDMLRKIVDYNKDERAVSLLISDCIYSLPPANYKITKQVDLDVEEIFRPLKEKGVVVSIFSSTSDFIDTEKSVNELNSPYYIWVIGKPSAVRKVNSIIYEVYSGSELEEMHFGFEPISPNYSMLPFSHRTFNFNPLPCEDRYLGLTEIPSGNPIQFTIGLDLTGLQAPAQQKAYLKENLLLEADYLTTSVKEIWTRNDTSFQQGLSPDDRQWIKKHDFSHFVQISVDGILWTEEMQSKTGLTINLNLVEDPWYEALSGTDDELNRKKTKGLKELIQGVNAVWKSSKQNLYFIPGYMQILLTEDK